MPKVMMLDFRQRFSFLGQFMHEYVTVHPQLSTSPLTFHKPVTEKNFCIFHSGETIGNPNNLVDNTHLTIHFQEFT